MTTVEFKYCTKRWIPAKHLLQKICRTVYRSPKHDSVKCNSTNCHSILFLEYDYDRVDIYLYLPIKSAYSSALNGRLASGERLTKALWLGEKTMCPVLTRRNNTSKYLWNVEKYELSRVTVYIMFVNVYMVNKNIPVVLEAEVFQLLKKYVLMLK